MLDYMKGNVGKHFTNCAQPNKGLVIDVLQCAGNAVVLGTQTPVLEVPIVLGVRR